jgi:hypothetical protein
MDAMLAKGGPPAPPTLYKLRFIQGVNPAGDGEIQSDWFPVDGITLNTRTPWKSLTINGATIGLVNYTHGDWPTCESFNHSYVIRQTNWDIAGTSPVLSYAGTWFGALTVSNGGLAFDGDRLVDGVLTPSAGGIHNVVSVVSSSVETKDPTGNNDWFQLDVRNAALKFGSASRADGVTGLMGVAVSCANFTLLAKKTSLITP